MEEKKSDVSAAGGQKSGKLKKYAAIILILILAGAGYAWYSYNLPEKRLARALEEADALLEAKNYEEASAAYEQAEGINGVSPEALEGHILSELYRADGLAAKASDIPSRAQACECYGQVVRLCDEAAAALEDPSDERFAQPRADADAKRTALQEEIAAAYDKVECYVEKEDRSGSFLIPGGNEAACTQYFDLAVVNDQYYPYADRINESLKQQKDDYFADPENDPSSLLAKAGVIDKDAVCRDYVGVEGTYSGQGLLCIRMAHVRNIGGTQSNDYCGRTFRLSDGGEVSLGDLTGKTDIGLRRFVRRAIWSWLQQEGYTEILKSDVEDYVEDLRADEYKFCIRDDGTLCLVIDQSVPFFADRQQTLEIPLEIDEDQEQ